MSDLVSTDSGVSGARGGPSAAVSAALLVSITVSPGDTTIPKGRTQQFNATGTFSDGSTMNVTSSVTWSSTQPAFATVSSSGLATGIAKGTARIRATSGTKAGGSQLIVTSPVLTSLAVTPANSSIAKGQTQQFNAGGTFSDGSTSDMTSSVSWVSTNTAAAMITSSGLVTAVNPGSAQIQASSGSIAAATGLTVTSAALAALAVSPWNVSIGAGSTKQFKAVGTSSDGSSQDLTGSTTWSSSNTSAVTITNQGLATAVSPGTATIQAASGSLATTTTTVNVTVDPSGFAGVFTYHNDNARTGQNLNETRLTLANVNISSFGKLFTIPVDGYVYAQPLYVLNLAIPNQGTHNAVYVATQNNTVYAFDGDDRTGVTLWSRHLGTPVSSTDNGCGDIVPTVGITSTPVIDPQSNTIYVVTATEESGVFAHQIHALDITTGAEKFGGPKQINATVPGTGEGGTGGQVTFDSRQQLNRSALSLINGTLFIGFGSSCDFHPYHGWLFAYNPQTLSQSAVFNTTANTQGGGIWEGGGAAGDPDNNLYVITGDGDLTANSGGVDYGDSILRFFFLSGNSLNPADFFSPSNQASLDRNNTDLGSGGPLLLPDQVGLHSHLLVAAGKGATIYLVDRGNLGHFLASGNTQILQTLTSAILAEFGTPAFWQNSTEAWVYFGGAGDFLKAFSLTNGQLSTSPTSMSGKNFPYPGTTASVSSNGTANGIVWSLQNSGYATGAPAALKAFDATDLENQIYSSTLAPAKRDVADPAVKFTVPTIANGKVYFGTQNHLDVYGLLP